MLTVGAEDRALGIVERLEHLQHRRRHRVDVRRDALALHRPGAEHGGERSAAQKPFISHDTSLSDLSG